MPIIQTQISAGIQPSGTKTITSNGIVDVTDYASANVQVPTTAPAHYIEKNSVNTYVINSANVTTIIDLTNITNIDRGALGYAYLGATSLQQPCPDFSNIEDINHYGCIEAFSGCTGLTGIANMQARSIGGHGCEAMFMNCTGLTKAIIGQTQGNNGSEGSYEYMCIFQGCTGLTEIDVSNICRLDSYGLQYGFRGCSNIANNIKFDNLWILLNSSNLNGTFANCTSISTVYFPALKTLLSGAADTAFTNMLSGCSNVTVHFPANLQSVIGNKSYITNGMGGTNTVILWDLPSAFTLTDTNSTQYYRNPKYDTQTALAWKTNPNLCMSTSVYTYGITDPQVGDTIYSDSACTTAVTTIDSIA